MRSYCRFPLLLLALWGAAAAGAEPFEVRAFGNFKRMAHSGDARAVVKLSGLGARPGSYGLGALAGLRGEVLLWDGKLLVTHGHSKEGRTAPAAPVDEAALFVSAQVGAWDETALPETMTQTQFEAFVVRTAKAGGIDVERAFPFIVRGALPSLKWHVVTGAAAKHGGADPGAGAHAQGHADNRVFERAEPAAILLGFYSGAALEGVITHPGERFHVHYADPRFSVSGHVDEYRVAKSAVLALPRQ